MLSCEAGGVTYGVATAEVRRSDARRAVLLALRDGAAARDPVGRFGALAR